MHTKTVRRLLSLSLVAAGLLFACSSEGAEDGSVHVMRAKGTIDPIMERYIDRGVDRAEDERALLLVIELDTPGGLISSMRDIVQRIEASDVPVAVYVWPPGARAASAGTFITMAGHVAAMAPSTSIGAASPVDSGGGDIDGTLGRKVEEDAVALIRGIAELRGRNADWAEQAVREAVAVNQSRALDLNVIDYIANDLNDLLAQAEGTTFDLRPGTEITLQGITTAPRVETNMTVWERFLAFLADPTVASLLITLGFLGLLIELAAPGFGVPGIAGVIAMALGFLGFGVLPVDTVGLVLIGLGLAFIAAEVFLPSGVLGAGGALALILGAIIAFRDTPSDFRPPTWLLLVLGAFLALMVFGIGWSLMRLRRRSEETDPATLMGADAVARTALSPEGIVTLQGEKWHAQMESGSAAQGDLVRVVGTDGFRLHVRKDEAGPPAGRLRPQR